jgi:hypothetical protein
MQGLENNGVTDDFQSTALYQQRAGYGFAAFSYVAGCIILFIAAIYISPLLCGSANERMMLRAPSEIKGGYATNNKNEATNEV